MGYLDIIDTSTTKPLYLKLRKHHERGGIKIERVIGPRIQL